MNDRLTVALDGRVYTWDGKRWHDTRYQQPPRAVVQALDELTVADFETHDARIHAVEELLQIARIARDAGQLGRAERAAQRVLAVDPGSQPALAVLSSILRERGAPDRALAAAAHITAPNHPPLLVSLAAAKADLGDWEGAKALVGRALAIDRRGDEAAFSVVHRIKAHRPDLYEP
jgi:tetratricopeptide (TPR) repeat protein